MRTDPFRVGDRVKVDFSGSPTPIPPVETEIKDDGTIRLDFVGDIQAAGKTPGEMERDIQGKYVPNFYTHLNVTVTPVVRYFYVDGEINGGGASGGRVMYVGPITVTRAIAAAGGFNPFAARTKVKLFRVDGKKAIIINCIKALDHPELDVPVYPGDKIFVPRRYF
ncbi:MAG TPA: polysaccharide biosynthesis/export family protein [Candidatus Saccharimonadales bacterium]|nr:polysaccharide biosynthesis/export family protein [Candidatus Saccharimonadales bacterium]